MFEHQALISYCQSQDFSLFFISYLIMHLRTEPHGLM